MSRYSPCEIGDIWWVDRRRKLICIDGEEHHCNPSDEFPEWAAVKLAEGAWAPVWIGGWERDHATRH